MASLIPGYEYDIFISYRRKDNKYDGWVTEFADNLKKELEATFKEDLSICFDENPHDGLLETHSVDKSLECKLNCLKRQFLYLFPQTRLCHVLLTLSAFSLYFYLFTFAFCLKQKC